MKPESIVLAVAGAVFGLLVGWIIGTQQAGPPRGSANAPGAVAAEATADVQASQPKPVDQVRVSALKLTADREPNNAEARVELGNLYFDADRPAEAVPWYEAALTITPRDVDVSTDLGVCYYYLGDADRALKQFDYSLSVNPSHTKTILNQGVVRAFGKQDLKGAVEAWETVVKLSPASAEGQSARKALDSLKTAHPELTPGGPPGAPPRGGA